MKRVLIDCSEQAETILGFFVYRSVQIFVQTLYFENMPHRHWFFENMRSFRLTELEHGLYQFEIVTECNDEELKLCVAFCNPNYFFVGFFDDPDPVELNNLSWIEGTYKAVADGKDMIEDLNRFVENNIRYEYYKSFDGIVFLLKERNGSGGIRIFPTLNPNWTAEEIKSFTDAHVNLGFMEPADTSKLELIAEFPFSGPQNYIQAMKEAKNAVEAC